MVHVMNNVDLDKKLIHVVVIYNLLNESRVWTKQNIMLNYRYVLGSGMTGVMDLNAN